MRRIGRLRRIAGSERRRRRRPSRKRYGLAALFKVDQPSPRGEQSHAHPVARRHGRHLPQRAARQRAEADARRDGEKEPRGRDEGDEAVHGRLGVLRAEAPDDGGVPPGPAEDADSSVSGRQVTDLAVSPEMHESGSSPNRAATVMFFYTHTTLLRGGVKELRSWKVVGCPNFLHIW